MNDLVPWSEIAEELGVSEKEVRDTYRRALRKVRNFIEKHPDTRRKMSDLLTLLESERDRLDNISDEDRHYALLWVALWG